MVDGADCVGAPSHGAPDYDDTDGGAIHLHTFLARRDSSIITGGMTCEPCGTWVILRLRVAQQSMVDDSGCDGTTPDGPDDHIHTDDGALHLPVVLIVLQFPLFGLQQKATKSAQCAVMRSATSVA